MFAWRLFVLMHLNSWHHIYIDVHTVMKELVRSFVNHSQACLQPLAHVRFYAAPPSAFAAPTTTSCFLTAKSFTDVLDMLVGWCLDKHTLIEQQPAITGAVKKERVSM
jgi:hypothetical protein